jgi:hypothetical protein
MPVKQQYASQTRIATFVGDSLDLFEDLGVKELSIDGRQKRAD